MRTIAPLAMAALASGAVKAAMLAEMYFPAQTVRLCSANINLTYAGNVYLGTGALGGIEEINDSSGEYKNLLLSLSAVSNDLLALALAENVRGKPLRMRLAIVSSVDYSVLDAPLVWSGSLDQMPIQTGKATSVINVSAEHRGVTYIRPKPLNYTDGDQQRLYPGDTSLKTVQANSVQEDTWPAASFFRQ